MNINKIVFALVVSALLIGGVCAASISDFNVDKAYKNEYNSEYYSVYSKDNQNTGVIIFQNVDDDKYDDVVNDDILEGVIHHDGRDYIYSDDDIAITKNSDNTINFTDREHAVHGVSEVVKSGNEQYIVVFWAKDSSNFKNADLISQLNAFNKDNSVSAIAA